MEEYIAFRTKDSEGDIWSEEAFLFKTDEDIRKFFNLNNPDFVKLFTGDDEDDRINNLILNDENPAKKVMSITFKTEYAGVVKIYEMSKGFII